ncbi:uncharacterized protein LOC142631252 [Castanea sativa]|uniref:uncharacterized protein LOC142631252 n=1 Tax=Castanea sativa TaxID=21020 RepID=UPI003F652D29
MELVECEGLEKVIISNDKEKYFQIGAQLPPREKDELMMFLRENIDVFAWNAYEAPRVDPSFICHHLNVSPTVVPRKQPPRRSSKEHSEAVKEEVTKLKQTGAINEVFYPEWLANTVVVKKKNGKWLVCVDFTNLNKACLKDPFPMPRIDQLVDATVGSFLQLLNKWKGFEWAKECALAFQQLKKYISRPPILSRPEEDEVLCAYIVVVSHAVSLVPVRVDNGVQWLVYYMRKSLHEAEIRYLPLKNAILAVGTILEAFDIKYMPRTSVKGQVLADLVGKFAEPSVEEEEDKQNMDGKSVSIVSLQEPPPWKVYVDGATNQRGSRIGLVIGSSEIIVIEKSLRLSFSATNNEAEYEALLVEGELEAKDPRMQEYLNQVRHLQSRFDSFTLMQVPRIRNTHVDSLATLTTSSMQSLPRVILVEDLCKPSKMKGDMVQVHQIRAGPSWMDSILLFLKEDILPDEKSEVDKLHRKAP